MVKGIIGKKVGMTQLFDAKDVYKRQDEHDPHGRARGCGDHQKPEAAGDLGHRLSAGLPHHHFGA